MIPIRTSGLEDTVLKESFVGLRTTILLMVMLKVLFHSLNSSVTTRVDDLLKTVNE